MHLARMRKFPLAENSQMSLLNLQGRMEQWSSNNSIPFHSNKCKKLSFPWAPPFTIFYSQNNYNRERKCKIGTYYVIPSAESY